MSRKFIAANWKMNKGLVQSQQFAEEFRNYYEKHKVNYADIVLCPPYTSLEAVGKKIAGSGIKLGAQNLHHETMGAYTGEICAGMLKSCGAEYVIIGHSERRQYFNETNVIVNKKVLKALDEGLKPILCVGETLQEHQDHITEAVIDEQLKVCLSHVAQEQVSQIVIAYEPVWAIGTGKNATSHQAESVHNSIRKKLKKLYNDDIAAKAIVIYGGSLNAENARELFTPETINGGLVGGASLEVQSFIEIINSTH
jgi:triosephosphate isomerase (TIM)